MLPSKRSTSFGASPAIRAASAVDIAQPYDVNALGSGRTAGPYAAYRPSMR